MNAPIRALATLAWALLASQANAYEQATHAAITNAAVSSSTLGDPSRALVRSLGLDGLAPLGDGAHYFEFISNVQGVAAYERKAQRYEIDIVDKVGGTLVKGNPLLTWLMYGAIREDDNPNEDPATPQDVETGLRRPLHHFFDPYFDRPLTVDGLGTIESDPRKSVDWALGIRNAFSDPNLEESPRRNRFTTLDAREAMFRALTLKAYANGTLSDLAAGAGPLGAQALRQKYWTTAFRALGNVLHLNQDMAQPQHTRNEVHSGILCAQAVCPTGHTSIYEKYIDGRAQRIKSFNTRAPFNQLLRIVPADLPLTTPYPVPRFSRYADYWSTAPGPGSLQGMGLADYSNRGFFTAAKNFGASEYAAPASDLARYRIVRVAPTTWDGTQSSGATPVSVYYGTVPDTLRGVDDADVPLTTFGIWDQFIQAKLQKRSYTLNRLNYDAMASLLLPRAVAYSAGLIDFFFRGTLDVSLPDEGVFAVADHGADEGFTKLRAEIRNTTPSFVDAGNNAQPQNMSGGTLLAVVRYHADKRYVASLETVVGAAPCDDYTAVIDTAKLDASTECRDGAEQIVVSRALSGTSLSAGAEASLEFDFSDTPIPFAMTDAVLQIVYRGALGGEADAVAVGTVDVSEPTYFTYQNASDYIHIGEHVYTRDDVDADPALLAQVQPQVCVDYRQSPPRLVGGCLDPFYLDLNVAFADLEKPLASVELLPPRRFVRIVYLTLADEPSAQAAKAAPRRVKIVAKPHAGRDKALLRQEGTCLPVDPFDIPPRHAQMTVVSSSQVGYQLDPLDALRGVHGWYNASCVLNGDGSIPGTVADDRVRVMSPLDPAGEEYVPYPVTVMPDFL